MKNRLLNLIRNNLDKPREFRLDQSDGEAELYIYDVIDAWWGFDANEAAKQVHAMDVANIKVFINSPGGDVFDAVALQTALKDHKATVDVQIDGLCASAATSISLAGDTVRMSEGGFYMVHKAWSLAFGNSDDFKKSADLLDKIDQRIAKEYAKKTGNELDDMIQAMLDETWYTADEAKEIGFVDEIIETVSTSNRFDLSAYDHAPEKLVNKEEDKQPHPTRDKLNRRLALWGTN